MSASSDLRRTLALLGEKAGHDPLAFLEKHEEVVRVDSNGAAVLVRNVNHAAHDADAWHCGQENRVGHGFDRIGAEVNESLPGHVTEPPNCLNGLEKPDTRGVL